MPLHPPPAGSSGTTLIMPPVAGARARTPSISLMRIRSLPESGAALELGLLFALAMPHTYEGIQLNSVGHVNQSVVYIVICFGALLAAISAYWQTMRAWVRAAALVELAILLVALFAAASRSAAATAMIGAFAFGL